MAGMARACADRGIVVSGLARGIVPPPSRRAGLGGRVAVLGSGIRHIHPRRSCRLAAQIAEHGAVISVAPDGGYRGAADGAQSAHQRPRARGIG